jgi:predicted MPP superfamily phosphohydrolase
VITRRKVLQGVAALSAGVTGAGGYAVAEPWRLGVTRYGLSPATWPADLSLRIAVLADLHACEPWMPAARVRHIVARTNALAPDLVLLLGDYGESMRLGGFTTAVPHADWAGALGELSAPLGVHAVLGNHDWWEPWEGKSGGRRPPPARLALERAGIAVYENDAVRLEKGGRAFWVAGLGDQWARRLPPGQRRAGRFQFVGVDDLAGTLRRVTDAAPVILMAHEPDIFPQVPGRVALTLSGHTHGGQVRVFGYAPVVPSKFGTRYVYGHVVEDGRHLVVSGGLGCTGVPVRFGSPPEIVLLELGAVTA